MTRDQSINIPYDILNGFQVGWCVTGDFYLETIFNLEHQFEQAKRVHALGAEQRTRRQPVARQMVFADQYVLQSVKCAHDGVPLLKLNN